MRLMASRKMVTIVCIIVTVAIAIIGVVIYTNRAKADNEKKEYNILILGEDAQYNVGKKGNLDSITVVTIKEDGNIKLTSLNRNIYIQECEDTISSIYTKKSSSYVKDLVEKINNITIDGTIIFNFATFKAAIDEFGGVDNVTLNEKEAQFINEECSKNNIPSNLIKGTYNLNASQALHFVRISKISSEIYGFGDNGREERQKYVMNQIFKKCKEIGYVSSSIKFGEIATYVKTDKKLKENMILVMKTVFKNSKNLNLNKDIKEYTKKNKYNMLILGEDNSNYAGEKGNLDSIIVLTINKDTKKVKVESVVRDEHIKIEGYNITSFDGAYKAGGTNLVKKAVENIYNININSTVVVNYKIFKVTLGMLGRVDGITLNEEEARFINEECAKIGVSSSLSAGTHSLNANQALHFVRISKISSDIYGTGEYGRVERQKVLIKQMYKKANELEYDELVNIACIALDYADVSINLQDDILSVLKAIINVDSVKIEEID